MKKLLASLFLLSLAACGLHPYNVPTYSQQESKVTTDCNKRLENKEFSKTSEMLEYCQKPNEIALFERYYGHQNSDIELSSQNKSIELTKKIEDGKISREEADKQMEKFNAKQLTIVQKRREAQQKAEAARLKKEEAERRKEQARLAKYYKEHPEVLIQQQQLQIQQQQLQAMQQQNAIAQQQMNNQQQQLNLQAQQQMMQAFRPQPMPSVPYFQPAQIQVNQPINCRSYATGNIWNTNCN